MKRSSLSLSAACFATVTSFVSVVLAASEAAPIGAGEMRPGPESLPARVGALTMDQAVAIALSRKSGRGRGAAGRPRGGVRSRPSEGLSEPDLVVSGR